LKSCPESNRAGPHVSHPGILFLTLFTRATGATSSRSRLVAPDQLGWSYKGPQHLPRASPELAQADFASVSSKHLRRHCRCTLPNSPLAVGSVSGRALLGRAFHKHHRSSLKLVRASSCSVRPACALPPTTAARRWSSPSRASLRPLFLQTGSSSSFPEVPRASPTVAFLSSGAPSRCRRRAHVDVRLLPSPAGHRRRLTRPTTPVGSPPPPLTPPWVRPTRRSSARRRRGSPEPPSSVLCSALSSRVYDRWGRG
jgi:hypothetical protein